VVDDDLTHFDCHEGSNVCPLIDLVGAFFQASEVDSEQGAS